jgi:hypothetical protein
MFAARVRSYEGIHLGSRCIMPTPVGIETLVAPNEFGDQSSRPVAPMRWGRGWGPQMRYMTWPGQER